jgi:hypothetical protein
MARGDIHASRMTALPTAGFADPRLWKNSAIESLDEYSESPRPTLKHATSALSLNRTPAPTIGRSARGPNPTHAKYGDRRHEPCQELVACLDRRARAASEIVIIERYPQGVDRGFALEPSDKEVTVQGVSVLPSRKPILRLRMPAGFRLRLAERTFRGSTSQEPPRATRSLQPSMVHAEPSMGAPL